MSNIFKKLFCYDENTVVTEGNQLKQENKRNNLKVLQVK